MEDLPLPPQAVESEQTVIGALMLDNAAFDLIAGTLAAHDFYRGDHREIYSAITRLLSNNQPADVITVKQELDAADQLDYCGGLHYLGQLCMHTPSAANIARHAEIVREKSILRQLTAAATEISAAAAKAGTRPTREVLDEAESAIFQIADQSKSRSSKGWQAPPPLLQKLVQHIDKMYQLDEIPDVTGTSTGFIDLDKMTSGLQAGDLIIIAGRPSMGKTAFAVNIAENVAIDSKLPAAIFSLEMSADQLIARITASVGRIELGKLRNGQFADEDWSKLTTAVSRISDAPILIDDTGGISALDIRNRARRLQRQHGQLGVIVIDYLQLMSTRQQHGSNRASELGEITRALKSLAKELACPIIALSQLSRDVEKRTDKRPVLSDLRESGAIEQDADLIMFMYRDEYYNPDSPHKGLAECIIGKQRNGPVGRVPLVFQGMYSRFGNAAKPQQGEWQ